MSSLSNSSSLYISAGMRRSGSTLLYNMLRLSLEESGLDFDAPEHFDDFEGRNFSNLSKPVLIQTHNLTGASRLKARVILTCFRDSREAARSMKRLFDASESEIHRNLIEILHHMQNLPETVTVFTYEALVNDKRACLERVAQAAGLDMTDRQFTSVMHQLKAIEDRSRSTASFRYSRLGRKLGKLIPRRKIYADDAARLHKGHISGNSDFAYEPSKEIAQLIDELEKLRKQIT